MMETRKFFFSTMEKKLLIDVVKKHHMIIENKSTDGTTVRAKNAAWDQIAVEYNASPLAQVQATSKQLRRLWTNIKQRQRDALTRERQHRLATGGGPPAAAAEIDPDLAAFNSSLLVEVPGAMDSDSAYLSDSAEPTVVVVVQEDQLSGPPIFTPDQMETIDASTTAPPASTNAEANRLGGAGGLVKLKMQVLNEDSCNRQRRLEELHQLEMELLRQKIEEAKANAELARLRLSKAKKDELS